MQGPGIAEGTHQAVLSYVREALNNCGTRTGHIANNDLQGAYNAAMHPRVQSGEMTEEQVFQEFSGWDGRSSARSGTTTTLQ